MHSVGNNLPLVCFCLAIGVQCSLAVHVLELILGPKLGRKNESDTFNKSIVEDLVTGFGYPFESHDVTTEKGNILHLNRIPYGRKGTQRKDAKRPVVLIQHGLVAASDMFLFQGVNKDLAYVLAESGFDVWLNNLRGNAFSMAHETLDPYNDKEYWDFSIHEVAYYDMSAVIDYILDQTEQSSLFYIGHSMGAAVELVLCSLRPEYNDKIRLHLALAPIVYVKHRKSISQSLILASAKPLLNIASRKKIYNVFPRRKLFSKMMDTLCKKSFVIQRTCMFLVFMIMGIDEQIDGRYFPDIIATFPAGTSLNVFKNFLHYFTKGDFSALDYENKKENLKRYGEEYPPSYNVSAVTHPVSLHYGEGDILVTEEDMIYLQKMLPNCIGVFPVPFPKFNHMDFIWATDARRLLYDDLIMTMDEYR